MSKINFNDIQDRYDTAFSQKNANIEIVKKSIIDNELIEKFESIQKLKEKIDSIELLEKYQKEIKKFFGEVYEIITAPGVNRFVEWLESLDTNGLDGNLRNNISKILIDEYSTFGEDIKSVVDNQTFIETGNSLFENIKKAVKINITKRVASLGTKKDEIIENIPEFIEELNELLNELSEIEELGFKDVKDFYTLNLNEKGNEDYKPEIAEKADYHNGLIKQIVEKKDFLTTNQDNISISTIVEYVKGSIDDINNSIETIKTIDISTDSEDDIQVLYNKFEKSLNFKTGQTDISDSIQESISDTWEKTIGSYNICQSFYSEFGSSKVDKLKNRKEKWINFEFANSIDNYISNLVTINTDNPRISLKTDNITKIKSRFVKTANKIGTLDDDNPKENIVEYFSNITSDFENKKIEILKKLKIADSEIEKIESAVVEINSFIDNINTSENLLDALNDDFIDGILGSYAYIKKEFTTAIEKSDIKDDLEYLDEISSDEYVLNKTDLEDNIERFKRLLEYDLININLTKNI